MGKIRLAFFLFFQIFFVSAQDTKESMIDIEKLTSGVDEVGSVIKNNMKSFINDVQAKLKTNKNSSWKEKTLITLSFQQASYSQWMVGGESNVTVNMGLDYAVNYKDDAYFWDFKMLANYGINQILDKQPRKTNDRLIINSIFGIHAFKGWKYSFVSTLSSQFSDGFVYPADFVGDSEKYPTSGLFAPIYLTLGPGFLWNKYSNINLNVSIASMRGTYIIKELYKYNQSLKTFESSKRTKIYGIEPNNFSNLELGFYASLITKHEPYKNIIIENILFLYSNYLKEWQNLDVNYTLNVNLNVSEWLTTVFNIQLLYDDNSIPKPQIKQTFGLGLQINI